MQTFTGGTTRSAHDVASLPLVLTGEPMLPPTSISETSDVALGQQQAQGIVNSTAATGQHKSLHTPPRNPARWQC